MSALATRIAEAISDAKTRGVSVKDVAAACEVSVQSVYQWKRPGERKEIEGTKLVELAAVTGFEALWLMKGKGAKKRTIALNGLEEQLIQMYRGLPEDFQAALLQDANKYLGLANPAPSAANPFNGVRPTTEV